MSNFTAPCEFHQQSSSTAAYLAATKILVYYSRPEVRTKLASIFRGRLTYERFGFSKLHKIIVFKPDDALRQLEILGEAGVKQLLPQTDCAGRTALSWAAHLGRGDIVQNLVTAGAKVQHQDLAGNSPFHYAAQAVNSSALYALLANRKNSHQCVALQNNGGWQALHHAAYCQTNPTSASLLIQAGAKVDAVTKAGKTPFMMAALMQRPKLIKYLHECRANVNHQDKMGWTALSLAIDNPAPSLETIRTLLDTQLSICGHGIRNENILHLVAKRPTIHVIQYLVAWAQDKEGRFESVDVSARNSE